MKKKIFSISQIKKYLNEKGLVIRKKANKEKESNFGTLARTFVSSTIIISIFSIAPLIINFTKERAVLHKNFENDSKNKLKVLLENKD